MHTIENFVDRIPKFEEITAAEKIKYFGYYLLFIENKSAFSAKQIEQCFHLLRLKPYSNVGSYIASKLRGKTHIFLKLKEGYTLERRAKEEIENSLGIPRKKTLSDNLFPFTLVEKTRGYIEKVAKQAIAAYDYELYDACLVMTRKLVETLIIELFERKGIESKIKNSQGHYFYLSDLITNFLSETSWTVSRNVVQGLNPIKKIGDLSAHNRRFSATKSDIDKIRTDLRIVIEEIVNMIDYPNWK